MHRGWYDRKQRRVRDLPCGEFRIYLQLEARRVDCRRCGAVKRERLEDLLEHSLHSKRYARHIGRQCRTQSIADVARSERLDWQTVKRLEMQYMQEQLERAGKARPAVIGIDEISVRKGHEYRIVVSDLGSAGRSGLAVRIVRRRVWIGFTNPSEKSRPNASVWR